MYLASHHTFAATCVTNITTIHGTWVCGPHVTWIKFMGWRTCVCDLEKDKFVRSHRTTCCDGVSALNCCVSTVCKNTERRKWRAVKLRHKSLETFKKSLGSRWRWFDNNRTAAKTDVIADLRNRTHVHLSWNRKNRGFPHRHCICILHVEASNDAMTWNDFPVHKGALYRHLPDKQVRSQNSTS